MAACPGCQKFASLELGDAEVDSEEVQEDGAYTAEIRVVRTSACCGEEMKEARFTIEGDVAEELADHIRAKHPDLAGAEDADLGLGITVEAEPTEDVRRVDRKGKPITNPRYMATLIGVSGTVVIGCGACGETIAEVPYAESMGAGEMEELV